MIWHPTSKPWQGYLALSASMALVGAYVALSKPLVAVLPVLLVAWLRFGIGALAMLPWLRKPVDEPLLNRQTKWLIFLDSWFGN
ncbi:MAG: EamA/RhaT family transporter, partial [Burkholderiaceae bacterium]